MRVASFVLPALVACIGFGSRAEALPSVSVDKCLAMQLKAIAKGAAAELGCHAVAASHGVATDPACLAKAESKVGPALDKIEAKLTCFVEGTGATRTSDVATFATNTDTSVGHAPRKCDATKTKLVGKYASALLGCHAKAAAKGSTVDSACVAKAESKLTSGIAKAETASDCSHTGQTAVLQNAAAAFAEAQTCTLDPANPTCGSCGNGISDPTEACDASVSPALWNECGPEFACVACNCACPTTMTFSPDAASPESAVDRGWIGFSHRAPLVTTGDLTLQVSCTGTSRPCGDCSVSGPIAGSGQVDDRRCSTNLAKRCMIDAECYGSCLGGGHDGLPCAAPSECPGGGCTAAGTCEFYTGAPQPFSATGIGACTVNRFAGPIAGTLTLSTGHVSLSSRIASQVYSPIHHDNPCPRCVGDGAPNDGVTDGTCAGGARTGLACDANGAVPGRPDFGQTSLDCPPIPNSLLADQTIVLDEASGPVEKTLTPDSPSCTGTGYTQDKCLCSTCNDFAAEACSSNADCPMSGGSPGICGGRRCLGSSNAGAPCTATSECPGGSCARPGVPTQPSSCTDDTNVPDHVDECADLDGDGIGVCTVGPTDQACSIASGHGQRGCTSDADCGGSPASCVAAERSCFPTGGGTFQPTGEHHGTDTLVAVGMADVPVRDAWTPTLASVFCLGPTGAPTINTTAGLPGPGRLRLQGHVVVHP